MSNNSLSKNFPGSIPTLKYFGFLGFEPFLEKLGQFFEIF